MNTLEIKEFLNQNNTRKIDMVVCAIDQLPKKISKKREYGIVFNLSHSSEIGSHWCALHIKKGRGTYFDSYAFPPKSYYIDEFIKKNCKVFTYNECQLQQLNSKVCGKYATCFILHMMNGGVLKSFTDKFSKNLHINDLFINKNYNYYLRNYKVINFLAKIKKKLKKISKKKLR